MRVLVTGGAGFVGSHVLATLVERGHEVASLDVTDPSPVAAPLADDVSFRRGDVTDAVDVYDAVAGFEPDRVVHLASLLSRACEADPLAAVRVNVLGALTVMEAAGALGVDRVVAAASVSAYGPVPDAAGRLTEDVTRRPGNVYGLTKYAVEELGARYAARDGTGFAALEPVHGLGPDRERGNVEDAVALKAAVAGVPLSVPAPARPYELIHVTDTARAFADAVLADDLAHGRYLVGTGEQVTLAEVVETARELVPGAAVDVEPAADDEFPAHPPTDAARIRSELGWEPRYSPTGAVEASVRWLRENPGSWSFDPGAVPWAGE